MGLISSFELHLNLRKTSCTVAAATATVCCSFGFGFLGCKCFTIAGYSLVAHIDYTEA